MQQAAACEVRTILMFPVSGIPVLLGVDDVNFNAKFGFWEVGMRSVLWDTLVVFFMVPLSVGAIDKLIPIFGSTQPTFFDQVFALILAGTFTLGINLLIALNLGRCYFGEVPKMAIRHLYGGIVTANVLKVLVLFLAYHLAFDFLTEERIVAFYELLWRVGRGVLGEDLILALAEWTFDLRIVLWKSAYAVIAITAVSLLIPFVVFLIGKYSVQREYALQQQYGLN
ncbi:MAG: hypothetical protein D6690_07130 [Nitrospirae bacterium]|nr:MAG: hypothetical protein D6690_07130 [Nitrospirota bacterium]